MDTHHNNLRYGVDRSTYRSHSDSDEQDPLLCGRLTAGKEKKNENR